MGGGDDVNCVHIIGKVRVSAQGQLKLFRCQEVAVEVDIVLVYIP